MNKTNSLLSVCIIALFVLLFQSCYLKTILLENNKTKVPKDSKVYSSKAKFDKTLLLEIDTSVIYERYDERKGCLASSDSSPENNIYDVLRFYSNGCFNIFYLNKSIGLNKQNFNPSFTGYRGIFYKEKSEIKVDFFAEINQKGNIGKIKATLIISGNRLIVKREDINHIDVYVKKNINKEYLEFNSVW